MSGPPGDGPAMSGRSAFVYSAELERYLFSEEHPFNPLRLRLTVDLLKASGLLAPDELNEPIPATTEDLLAIHDPDYVRAVKAMSDSGKPNDRAFTHDLGTEDNPVFRGMHEASQQVVGATLTAANLVMSGQFDHAVNLSGGLHHAQRSRASGFCIYNDVAVAIAHLRRKHGIRVAYIDTDAHHGDGVQWLFYEDPDVLTISFHETGRYLFPGTGSITERGLGPGYGSSVNVPLEPYTEDESFLSCFRAVVPPVLRAFRPDIIVTQHGCDSHRWDPLSHLSLTMEAFHEIPRVIHELAHEVAGGRWIAVGGGGYDIWRVVPRAWSLLWAELAGRQAPALLPEAWLGKWRSMAPTELPMRFLDDPAEFPPMPRRQEISEKNWLTVRDILSS